jgi:hypothetical protein
MALVGASTTARLFRIMGRSRCASEKSKRNLRLLAGIDESNDATETLTPNSSSFLSLGPGGCSCSGRCLEFTAYVSKGRSKGAFRLLGN